MRREQKPATTDLVEVEEKGNGDSNILEPAQDPLVA